MINEKTLNKIIKKSINEVINEAKKGSVNGAINLFKAQDLQPKTNDTAKTIKFIPKKMTKDSLDLKRKQSKEENEEQEYIKYMDGKVQSALATDGIIFPKGMEITDGKRIKYSAEPKAFIIYVTKMYPEYKINKSFKQQLKKERGQLDDIVYYDVIIKLTK